MLLMAISKGPGLVAAAVLKVRAAFGRLCIVDNEGRGAESKESNSAPRRYRGLTAHPKSNN